DVELAQQLPLIAPKGLTMMRIASPLAAGLIALCLVAAGAAAEPALRANVVVNGPAIRLGDLFSDAGANAAVEIAPAPALGGRTVLEAAWLAARAREQNLAWQPKSRYDQATVE